MGSEDEAPEEPEPDDELEEDSELESEEESGTSRVTVTVTVRSSAPWLSRTATERSLSPGFKEIGAQGCPLVTDFPLTVTDPAPVQTGVSVIDSVWADTVAR